MSVHSEIIDLASEGYFYPSNSKYSSGKVHIFPITGENEELLANSNLARRGLLDDLFFNKILDGGYDKNELLQCDKESILLNLRIANYGAYTKIKSRCEDCDADYDEDIAFLFKSKPFNFSIYEKGINKLHYVFPKCKKTVYFKLPTCAEYDVYIKHGWLAFAKIITISIDDVSDINNFYEYELSATDSGNFRKYFETRTPGYINEINTKCPTCSRVYKSKMDINLDIFGIKLGSKTNIHSEIFDLCYYSNGAFTQEGVYKMPTNLRAFYIKKLVDAKKAEADANKSASEGKSDSGKIAKPPAVKR